MHRDSASNTIRVALLLCVVCSVVVSLTAVGLRQRQQRNAKLDYQRNILECCGLADTGGDTEAVFQTKIRRRLVELRTGRFVSADQVDPDSYQVGEALRDPAQSEQLASDVDIAQLGRREKYAFVYLYYEGEDLRQIVLPIRGYGLWSTLWGFISLDAQLEKVQGITFYEHKETPGLGGEVDNPHWKQQWRGKQAFAEDGSVLVQVVRGQARDPAYQVDGLAGATITTRGVSRLVEFWLGPEGFGPLLENRPFAAPGS